MAASSLILATKVLMRGGHPAILEDPIIAVLPDHPMDEQDGRRETFVHRKS
jgi:hypothetical protein